jgi:hypothetical protein
VTVSATVVKANTPRLMKGVTSRTTFVSISVNIENGHLNIYTGHDLKDAEKHFTFRGDPPIWRGLQIIRVDA